MLALIALIVASFTLTSRADIQLARNLTDSARARELADAGVTRAVVALSNPNPARRWLADGRPYVWRFGDGVIVISVQNASGKISVNGAPQEVLQSAFTYAGAGEALSASLAQAIIDRRQALPDRRRMGPAFVAEEDLQTLPGMTAQIYYRAATLMTVYGQSATVDAMAASRDVLLALPNADPNEIGAFLAARARLGEEGVLPPMPPLSVARYLGPEQSGTITVLARATTGTGAVFVRHATVTLQDNGVQPFVIRTWRQELAIP